MNCCGLNLRERLASGSPTHDGCGFSLSLSTAALVPDLRWRIGCTETSKKSLNLGKMKKDVFSQDFLPFPRKIFH